MKHWLHRHVWDHFVDHPFQPYLTQLSIGLWATSFLFDLLSSLFPSPHLSQASYYCILAGLTVYVASLPMGWAEYLEITQRRHIRSLAQRHVLLSVTIFVLYTCSLIFRHSMDPDQTNPITAGLFSLSAFSILLLGASAFTSGQLVCEFALRMLASPVQPNEDRNLNTVTNQKSEQAREAA